MQLIYSDKKQASGCLRQGRRAGRNDSRITKQQEKTFGGDEYTHYCYIIMIIVMIS